MRWPGRRYTFDIPTLLGAVPQFSTDLQRILFWGFFFAFAIKVPMFPFHTWLPDAHTEAPTAGSVILAGVLLKMGTYGFIRFSLPLLPDDAVARQHIVTILMVLSIIGIIYGALVCMMQKDMKKLVAYSSVSHLGFCTLGIFALNPHGPFGQRHPADQPRNFHRRALLADRRAVRTAAHAADFGIRRALHAHAEFRGDLHDRHAQLAGPAAAQRLHRRVHHSERRLSGEPALGGLGRDRHRAGRGVPACGSTSA